MLQVEAVVVMVLLLDLVELVGVVEVMVQIYHIQGLLVKLEVVVVEAVALRQDPLDWVRAELEV
jgi:hypothetical protein